ncbi:neuropeptide Y receptor type 4-2 [Rhineura floridana]|uniref:neuropeptide Y receptor type 4-2 n=1 Tax=Rhineura floridana TaxID=261503 RepID=UPI002AC8560E|nr:neuropeptide Y receptor type 4-2 [Rhineura floridana]XP_061490279.1 neuropeptide Y receptor type 4-2 [Rhineura floridana]XP_061490280.1 neuropeptide Y receptor type 4-2 [Rhineura floridana]XP_061490282.1 neuropeptide Y receptor type 4-2 [Rhineura floridana]XP_061490283.1 neuropeptide Y receptor type 4-2 [Rhineura floridana]XP_061490284.1 neuropeptide Y receptor type 4-2 [Rhineura floridana]XP_061490285.1 neuropeptide Y receptor type 4-2 [Rhineura floridana]
MNRTITFNTISLPQSNWSFPFHTILPCRNSTDITVFLVTSYTLETIIGVLGNMCFIGILARHKEKAIVTNVFITNLIASDFVMCIFCLPFTVVTVLLNYWIFGEAMCRMTSFIQCTSLTVSILSLLLIALERHQLIINPMGWRPSLSQAYLGIAIVWIFASFLSLPFVTNSTLINFFFEQFYMTDSYASKAICVCSWPTEEYRLTYATVLLLLQYCIPLFFIVVCYLHIYFRLQKREAMFEKKHNYNCRAIHLKQINILLALMVIAFAVCWLPLHVFNSIDDWNYKIIPHCLHDLIFSLCHLVAMASACINPIIYGFLNKNFKKEVKALILNCQHHSSAQEHEMMPTSTRQTEVSKDSLLSSQQNPIRPL